MSSTKIVIIVLVLIGLLFVIFVARGALRSDPKPAGDRKTEAKKTEAPGWTKGIEDLFSSLKPKRALEKKSYSASAEDRIKPDDKQPFRTVKFHLLSGSATINYTDETPVESEEMEELKEQECPLPGDFDPEHPKADRSRCSIVALKRGGKVTITCNGNSGCRVEVE